MTAALAAVSAAAATPAAAQEVDSRISLELAPPGVQFVVRAADSILASGGDADVSLESFQSSTATGVYLHGRFRDRRESVGYGRDGAGRRYLWLSVSESPSREHMAMLYDLDLDLVPDYLLFRTLDRERRTEELTEYRAPPARDAGIDIAVQPGCAPPRCDPATWTVRDRVRVDVPAFWFEMWRPVMGFAAMRGERWLGRPVAALPAPPSGAP